jgi:tape measure domain-containing protein
MASKSLGTLSLDLIVQTGGFESGMDKASRIADRETRKIERLAQERAKSIEIAFSGMAKSISGPLAAAFSIAGLSNFISGLAGAQQQADKLRNALTYSAGSAAGAAKELGYLRDVSAKLGLDFNSASQAYAKFAAATKGSGISAEQTKTVFEGIAAASSKLGLSADETQGALLALSQMASKGTVSAEELRGQLGERLPGALKLAAQAMGVTQAEFGKLLETGQILANDFLPKFGAALKNEFAGSVNSLTMEINRLNSSWDIWKQNFANSDGGGFKWITNGLNESAAAMRNLGAEAGVVQKILMAIGGFALGSVGAGKFDTIKQQEQALLNLAEAKKKVQELEAQEQKYGSLPPITARRLEGQRWLSSRPFSSSRR